MSITKAEAFQHSLCIDLTRERLQYAILENASKRIVEYKSHEVLDFDREGLEKLLTDEALFFDYSSISIAAGSVRNTLIPFDLFSSSAAKDIFALNYPKPFDNVDYNRIPELGIVNIYEFPLWMKSAMVIKFPRIKLLHRSTVFLKGIFDQPTFSGKIHLFVEEKQCYLAITHKSKLQFFNRFDIPSFSDLAYHLTFVMEQKEIGDDFQLMLYGVNNSWEHLEGLKKHCPVKVKLADEREKAEQYILAKQLLCV